MAKPRVRKEGKRLIVTHDHPSRLYDSAIYPVRSSNGSTVVLSGTEHGLHVAWHGGKPLYFTSSSEAPAVNGTSGESEDGHSISEVAESDDEALFDSDDEDLDEDHPYPPIIQALDIPLASPVLDIAMPKQPDMISTSPSSIFAHAIVVALACFDGSLRVLTLPLDPPSAATKRKRRLGVRQCALLDELNASHFINFPRSLAMSTVRSNDDDAPHSIIVACSGSNGVSQVAFYNVPCNSDGQDLEVLDTSAVRPFASISLSACPSSLSFNRSHTNALHDLEIAIAQDDGNLQVWRLDSIAADSSPMRVYTAGYEVPKDHLDSVADLTHRKRILDASWVFNGHAILALLEDGEWGVWVVDETQVKLPDTSANTRSSAGFAIRGFLGDVADTNGGDAKKSKPHLAPVTPNTRRVRQENLFKGPAVQTGKAPRGGVSVTSTTQISTNDDSVLLWYGSEVHSIPSLRTLWSRSGRDTGTLYGPGVSRVEGFNLCGETINCAHQLGFRQEATSSGLGTLEQRDVLITTEHRWILVTSTRPQVSARALVRRDLDALDSPLNKRDQLLLGQGELDLGGVDRLLDGMVGVEATGRLNPRRVGFAAT